MTESSTVQSQYIHQQVKFYSSNSAGDHIFVLDFLRHIFCADQDQSSDASLDASKSVCMGIDFLLQRQDCGSTLEYMFCCPEL